MKKWRDEHPEYSKKWRQENPNRLDYEKKYYSKNQDRYLENKRKNRQENVKRELEYRRNYVKQNIERVLEYHRQWKSEKRQTDICYKLKDNVSRRIRSALNGNTKWGRKKSEKTQDLLGCSIENLKCRLESFWEIGMTWENYGRVWHMDHTIPCAFWKLDNSVESKLCWNFRNIQPMWAFTNKSKKDDVNEMKCLYYKTLMETLFI
jgi:hypothetical protein